MRELERERESGRRRSWKIPHTTLFQIAETLVSLEADIQAATSSQLQAKQVNIYCYITRVIINPFMLKISKIMKLDKNSTLSVTHVIFDLDGTILDTESVYRKAYRKVSSWKSREGGDNGLFITLVPTL